MPTAERGHEDIGVKSGVCVGNDDREQIFWFLCEPNTVSGARGFQDSLTTPWRNWNSFCVADSETNILGGIFLKGPGLHGRNG